MSYVKNYNKKTGVTYVYEAKSYWDPDLKAPRSHRTLIGKIMPGSDEIIPTGTKGGRREKKSVEEKEAAWKAKKAGEEIKKEEEKELGLDNADYKRMFEDANRNFAIRESYKDGQIARLREMVAEQERMIVSLTVQLAELATKVKKTLFLLDELVTATDDTDNDSSTDE